MLMSFQIYISDFFKVIKIDADHVAEYTRRYLPKDWTQTRPALVTWDISNDQHPPLDWIQQFWKYLNNHFSELSQFCGLPLIPISPLCGHQPVSLAKLQRDTTLIFQKSRQITLPDQVAQLVNKVGGTVVGENTWLRHEDLETYVLSPSPRSVISVLLNVDFDLLIHELNSASLSAREQLKDYLSRADYFSNGVKCFVSALPLFLTMKGEYVVCQLDAVLLTSGLTVPAELPMPDSVVQCATEADRRLLKLLEVRLLDTAEAAVVLVDCIERGTCSKEDTKKTMTWILQYGNILFSQNDTLKHRCKELSFIEMNGELKKASDFFDPGIQTFTVIFESDFFPPQSYTDTPQKLASLRELGLLNKEMDVSPQHLLHAASLIEELDAVTQTQTRALETAQELVKMLNANDLLAKFSHEQIQHLKMIKWVPCEQPEMPTCLFSPQKIKHSMYKDIVGHVMPVVDKLSDSVSDKLGLKRRPPPEKVRENLSVLELKAQNMSDPNTNADFKMKLHRIYKYMQDNMSEFETVPDMDTRWLWSHKQFVSPGDLVLNYPSDLDLSSYIGKLPQEFLHYTMLFQRFGLRSSLSDDEVIHILYSVQQDIEARQQPFASSAEIKVSIEILNWLWKEKKMVVEDIPVPVLTQGKNYTMTQSSRAVFCDLSKNRLNDLKNSEDEIHVIHEEIPKATAEWLNIRFLSTCILDPELVGIEQWGQSEPITTRIKNILKEYDEEGDIFKELIQNAEDAGAEICKFLVDFRVHRDAPESLIDPDMALCQGPCLWAYNNERFTDLDWKNVVSVGAASKENNAEKIGKFGLGFNTVYHVTDVPSILSGNTLLILDPNVTHMKKHIKHKTNPGLKLDLSKRHLFHWFPGQFGPYEHIFDCNFSKQSSPEPYPGTLIKLPFRTEEEAAKSEISKKVFHRHSIDSVQQHFTKNPQTHLLFLKNISALTLQNMSNDASTPPRDNEIETVLTVSRTTVKTMMIPDEACVSKQRKAEKSLMKLEGKFKEVIDCCKFRIVQITSQQSGVIEVQSWLIYNCFGTNQSSKMALSGNKQATFSLPIGGVAVPLQNDPESGKLVTIQSDLVGQAFCFLPLSIHTGLPVNVNGTFAVTSNRKGLWESGVKHDWNKALLQDPVVTAYLTVLSALQKMSGNKELKNYCYHTFWPDQATVSDTFKPLVDAFYTTIAQDGPELFSDGEHWCSIDNAIFLDEAIEEDGDIIALVVQVCKTYIKPPYHVVPLPMWLRTNFKHAGLEMALQKRTWDWKNFYQQIVFNNLDTMDSVTRNTLVLHAIDLQIKGVDDLLASYPCIPTRSGHLQHIRNLVNPSGKAACLFESEEGRLLGGTANDFCCPWRIRRLIELGMASDHLPMKDLAEKAGTVCQTWGTSRSKANEQLKCLLELLKYHMPCEDKESSHWETLRMTEFLPAFTPSTRNVTLRRPTDVFRDKWSLLVNMTQPVLDHSSLNIHNDDPILQILRVRDSPNPENVLDQLQGACNQAHTTDITMLNKIAYECYKFLDHWISNNGTSHLISHRANSFPFILVGNTFVNVASVAEEEQFEAKPFLHMLPQAFTGFRNLWESLDVKRNFTINQFRSVLLQLRSKYGRKPLRDRDLSMCFTILNTGIFQAKEKAEDDFLIPNTCGVLQPANELFYNDSPWMPVVAGTTLCHENISRPMARHFKIKTTRHYTLQNHVAENISPFAFQFEQKEKLTVRIKNIISAYPSKKDILKELLQNADDAGATEIHFVWDKRHHGKDKTFGKKWNPLQGPALCVFNNKVFTETDLHGIQQLGEGGKHSSPGKTGKYGVGFNSVYHLTDCPSILTGDKLLCISDPNQKYIESHSKKPSGIGYKLDDIFKNMYIDVYNSFLPNQFELKMGTMFRLPLRMGTMANSSEISQAAVTDRDMEELMSALSEDPEGLILFLKNICKIKVHEISGSSGKLQTIFTVEKSIPETSRDKKEDFVTRLQNALQSDKSLTSKGIYGTTISTSDKRKTNWIIAEQFGSERNMDGKEISPVKKLPQAAIAACVSPKGPNDLSFYSSCTDFRGAAFCSLPLPGKTGLPVHVNANFEVDAARRGLWKEDGQSVKAKWNETLKLNVIAPLYADLLYFISRSVAEKKVNKYIGDSLNKTFLCFWPTVSKDVNQDWHEMIHEVYRSIKQRGLNVIPVMRSSSRLAAGRSIKEYTFDWCNVIDTEPTMAPHLAHPENDQLTHTLEALGMKLVPYSTQMQKVWTGFKSAGIELKEVNPLTVQVFLREKPLCDSNQTDKELPLPINATLIRNAETCAQLLSFCLKDVSVENALKKDPSLLNGLPLLLTKDQVLRVFNSDSPKWMSRYDKVFVGYEEKFADFQTNRDHKNILQSCKVVNILTLRSAVKDLKLLSRCLLQNCALDPDSGLHAPDETMLKWLKLLWEYLTSEVTAYSTSATDKETITISVVRQLFSDCCILPVICPRLNNKSFLTTMKDMTSVIHFSSDRDISGVLFKLGFLKINSVFFNDILLHQQVHSHLHTELMDVNDKSSVLDQVYNVNHSEFSKLSNNDMKELQTFLQSGISKAKDTQLYQSKLKSLPIFETIHGERVRLDGHKPVYLLRSSLSATFPDLFSLSCNNVFLKDTTENLSLCEALGISVLTDLTYVMKFILPVVHSLTESHTICLLKLFLLLQHDPSYFTHKEQIISSMKTVKLIRSSKGSLEMASYYYDDSIKLFKKMLPKERFVPDSFWTKTCEGNEHRQAQLTTLLKELGMKHVVSEDDLVNFAKQLESEIKGNCHLEDLKRKSTLLLEETLTLVRSDIKNKHNLLKRIADIEFIFPVVIQKQLCDYHQPFATKGTAVKIRGSLIDTDPRHQQLIWSSMPIVHLPVYLSSMILQRMKDAGAHDKPPPESVTGNIVNICQSPCTTDALVKTRAEVFRSSYAYLQANRFKMEQLAGLPVVLVEKDKKLVRTDAVCLHLFYNEEFRPYLYQISPQDILLTDIFKTIGVNQKPTAVQYCNVLEAVYTETRDKTQLQPNQMKTVKRAVQRLFLLIKENKSNIEDVKTLYLPATDGKLHPSCELYFNDTAFEVKRLEEALDDKVTLLEKLSECHLGSDRYEHHEFLQLLPERLQPKMLSQITEERVNESKIQLCDFETGCEFRGWFDKHLSSVAFRHGLICLIRHHSKGKTTHEEAADMCTKTFGSIKIICCKSLKTKLWLNNLPLYKTDKQTGVYVKQTQQGCVFYLKHHDNLPHKVINKNCITLANEINALLSNRIELAHLSVLFQFLMCDNLKEVQGIMAQHDILDSIETKSALFNPPAPGTDIPEEWHDALDMDMLNNFEEGEYVGYYTNNKYIYAVIVKELPRESSHYSCRYLIDIGEDEPVEVSCLDLFQFKRVKKQRPEGRADPNPSPETSCMELEPLAGAGPHVSQPPPTPRSSPRSSPASLDEAKKEIDKCLAEIWTLPKDERTKAIKRLYLRWHPDKNPDCQLIATEAFKYLMNQIEAYDKGTAKPAASSSPRQNSNFRDFYQEWNQEAKRHRTSRENFRGYRGFSSYNFYDYHGDVPRPDRKEAQRWFRQARCDLQAADIDCGKSTEWCLFKVHQAVEKSLIAAQYKKCGQYSTSMSISAMAKKVSSYSNQLRVLPQLVASLQMLGVDARKTQYPNCHPQPHIPNEHFTPVMGRQALREASELLRIVEDYIN